MVQFGPCSRQAISQHLALLEQAGLVRTERAGRTKLHHLTTEPLREIAQRWTHPKGHLMLRINVTSVFVDDQAKALAFYTDKLGFLPGYDMPAGGARWLTVRDGHSDVELLLEPNGHPAAQTYQKALVADGIPCTQFAVDNVQVAYDELTPARGDFHAAADRDGSGDHRDPGRHLRQSDPDRGHERHPGVTRRAAVGTPR